MTAPAAIRHHAVETGTGPGTMLVQHRQRGPVKIIVSAPAPTTPPRMAGYGAYRRDCRRSAAGRQAAPAKDGPWLSVAELPKFIRAPGPDAAVAAQRESVVAAGGDLCVPLYGNRVHTA